MKEPISPYALGAVWIFAIGILAARAVNGDGWVRVLDDANLVFHEAGHPIFGLFYERLGVYGGTLMQLALPVGVTYHFWRSQQLASCAVAGVWLFENFLNIGRYMSDARAQILPLIGSGEHDWTTIFLNWGVLHHDTRIGGFVTFLGWIGMLCVCLWITFQWSDRRS